MIIEDQYDYPRETQLNMSVEVRWSQPQGDMVKLTGSTVPSAIWSRLSSDGMLVPEYGQSVATAQVQSIQRLATQSCR